MTAIQLILMEREFDLFCAFYREHAGFRKRCCREIGMKYRRLSRLFTPPALPPVAAKQKEEVSQ